MRELVGSVSGRVEGEGERILGEVLRRNEAEGVDGVGELHAIRRERHEQLQAVLDGVRRDGREVRVGKSRQHELARRALRLEDRLRMREGEVEEDQEVAPGGRVERLRRSAGLPRLSGEIDRIDREDLLLLSVIEDLEVLRLEAADRVPVAIGDAHGHLDEDGFRGFGERRLGLGRGGMHRPKQGHGGDRDRDQPEHGAASGKRNSNPPRRRRRHRPEAGRDFRSRCACAICAAY